MKNKKMDLGTSKVFISHSGLNMSFYEWLNYYGSIDNMPLSLVVKICDVYNLCISGVGNGNVRLINEVEV